MIEKNSIELWGNIANFYEVNYLSLTDATSYLFIPCNKGHEKLCFQLKDSMGKDVLVDIKTVVKCLFTLFDISQLLCHNCGVKLIYITGIELVDRLTCPQCGWSECERTVYKNRIKNA